MTHYIVHIYREMRLSFTGITADTPETAASIARDMPTDAADNVEDCEGDNLTALVDVAGDEECRQSVTIDFEPERLRKAAAKLLAALEALANQAADDCPSGHRSHPFDGALEQARTAIAEVKALDIVPLPAATDATTEAQ